MDSSQAGAVVDDPLRRRHRPLDEADVNVAGHHLDGQQQQQPQHVFLQTPHLPPAAAGMPRRDRATNFHRAAKPRAAFAYAAIGICYLLMGIFVHQRTNSYPEPKNSDNSLPSEFREKNARRYLEQITSFGPRVSGSEAHVKAEQYILEVIQEINANKLSHNEVEVSIQTVSGGLTVDFVSAGMGEFSSVYQNLKNVIVKVAPPQGANSSLLVNCHYDTVIDSPGAGDDAASCAVMLEMLRVLTHSSVYIMHNIIFLFNGAEENMLQTSMASLQSIPGLPVSERLSI
ncbi:unnamed protein product [Candidula unifasciata]|uniref:Peptidase M28 domain-containing protein n=1 Tax=Candidula unifasciata TaxID=100452 RepID=A0A8S3ZCK6_9EUPU|nr:unnamed protein product [Candidula unifasciata]